MLKYIHLFETEQDFIETYNEFDTYLEPWLSYTEETDSVSFNNPDPPKPYEEQYFTVKAVTDGNITWKCINLPYDTYEEYIITSMETKTVYYSKNGGEWTEMTTSGSVDIAVTVGDKIRFKGNNATYQGNGKYEYEWDPGYEMDFTFNYSLGASTAQFEAEGNIMSLLYGDNFSGQTTLQSAYTFSYLFVGDSYFDYDVYEKMYLPSSLTSAKNLILPATTLTNYCYNQMFYYCCRMDIVPELPATTLANNCYSYMFYRCSSLTTAPSILPATTLVNYCYYYMFGNCTSLTTAPELPATTLEESCYRNMFNNCSSLTTAPELPATTLATSCYQSMFYNCTSLTTAPELPATTLEDYCYSSMFYNCTSLTTAPELPATTLAPYCYSNMFSNCTSLTTAPELPATTLAPYCYQNMFVSCSGLTTAPELPATTLANYCYSYMFYGCRSLTTVPELPATTLTRSCYNGMFTNCSSLTTVPELPATTLATECYSYMFNGCSSLNYIKCLATDISASQCTNNWVYGVSSIGLFIKPDNVNWSIGNNGIPTNWATISPSNRFDVLNKFIYYQESSETKQVKIYSTGEYPITITCNDSWISVDKAQITESGYSTFNVTVSQSNTSRQGSITLTANGKSQLVTVKQNQIFTFGILSDGNIKWRAYNTAYTKTISYSKDNGTTWSAITSTTAGVDIPVVAGDSVMFKANNTTYSSGSSRYNTFSGSTASFEVGGNIMSLLYGDNFSGQTTLPQESAYTFSYLFVGCTGLTSAQNLVLPAITLTNYCYSNMFTNCSSLITAPELPATTLAPYCYQSMFNNCSSLATAPELPATTLEESCYRNMFNNCSSLTTAPELPATTLATSCYQSMFYNCTSLTTAPSILPATTLAPYCYQYMFNSCSGLTTAPSILPATTLATCCYQYMFHNCTGLTTAPELPATTLAERCYYGMFEGCSSLNYIKCLATNISASNCTNQWVYGVSSTGTFIKDASMSSWTTGNRGIPSGWTVQDAS